MMKPKYRVYSGYVISKNDGDRHFISEQKLVHLYHLQPIECVGSSLRGNAGFRNDKTLIDLYPRNDGDYSMYPLLQERDRQIKALEQCITSMDNESIWNIIKVRLKRMLKWQKKRTVV